MLLDETISKMEKKLEECPKEEQTRLLGIIDCMDEISITLYMSLMVHKSRLVRKVACEELIKKGKAVIIPLKTTLERRNDWYFIRNALMVLSEVGKGSDSELAETFKRYLNHEEPRVRVEAVKGVANIIGADAEKLLINALKDDDLSVKRKAIWALGEINSLRPNVISYFIDTITGKRQEDESIIEQILLSIQRYPPGLHETRQLEQAILEVISKSHTILGRFTAKYSLSEYLRMMACETLGHIGGQETIEVLKKIARKDSRLRTKAIEAIERIKERVLKQSLP
jgi:HEAT repeat protein